MQVINTLIGTREEKWRVAHIPQAFIQFKARIQVVPFLLWSKTEVLHCEPFLFVPMTISTAHGIIYMASIHLIQAFLL